MTQQRSMRFLALPLVVAALAASGCGSSGGDSGPVSGTAPSADMPARAPDSASASVGGFIAYLRLLANNPSDTAEPVDVSNVTPPQPQDTEPESLG